MSNPNEPVKPTVDAGIDLDEFHGKPKTESGDAGTGAGSTRTKKEGRREGGKRREVSAEKRDRSQEVARAFYAAKRPELYNVVLRNEITSVGDDGETVETPIEEWSYAAYVDQVATDALGMSWQEPEVGEDGKATGKRKKVFAADQPAEAHREAREAIREMLTTRFNADAARVQGIVKEMHTAAKDPAVDKKAVLRAEIVDERAQAATAEGEKPKGVPLEFKMKRWFGSLEDVRLRGWQNSVDWFTQRVADAEASMKGYTQRVDATDSVQNRLTVLASNAEFAKRIEELQADIALFKELLETQKIDGGSQQKSERLTKRVAAQVAYAERTLQRFQRQREALMKLAEIPEGETLNPIDKKRAQVAEQLAGIGDYFVRTADYELIGMSPDEELNFWDALNEGLNDTVRPVRRRDGMDDKAWHDLRNKRLGKLNEILHLYEKKTVDGRQKVVLVRTERKEVEEGTAPEGFDQLVVAAKAEAQLLAEFNKKLKQTTAIMGPEFKRFMRREVRGLANATKIEIADHVNATLSKLQTDVVKQLGSTELTAEAIAIIEAAKKTTEVSEAPAEAAAETTTEASAAKKVTFGEVLAGRRLNELKWSNPSDKVLQELVRAKVYEVLAIGTPGKLDVEAARALLDTTSAEDAKDEAELKQEAAAEPLFDLLVQGKVDAGILEEIGYTPEALKAKLIELRKQLQDALSVKSVVRDAAISLLEQRCDLSNGVTAVELTGYIKDFEILIAKLAKLKSVFGVHWAKEMGLSVKGEGDQISVDEGKITAIINGLDYLDTPATRALEFGVDPAMNAVAEKVMAPDVKAELDKFEIEPLMQAHFVSELVSRAKPGERFDVNVYLKRLTSFLGFNEPQQRGRELLAAKGLGRFEQKEGAEQPLFLYDQSAINIVFDTESNDQPA